MSGSATLPPPSRPWRGPSDFSPPRPGRGTPPLGEGETRSDNPLLLPFPPPSGANVKCPFFWHRQRAPPAMSEGLSPTPHASHPFFPSPVSPRTFRFLSPLPTPAAVTTFFFLLKKRKERRSLNLSPLSFSPHQNVNPRRSLNLSPLLFRPRGRPLSLLYRRVVKGREKLLAGKFRTSPPSLFVQVVSRKGSSPFSKVVFLRDEGSASRELASFSPSLSPWSPPPVQYDSVFFPFSSTTMTAQGSLVQVV